MIHYDPFVAESLVLGYHMPTATKADRAAAIAELEKRGFTPKQITERMHITQRTVMRLRNLEVEPLPPLPEWAEDYDKEWPKCSRDHEQTPDNFTIRWDGRCWRRICFMCRREYERMKQQQQKGHAS